MAELFNEKRSSNEKARVDASPKKSPSPPPPPPPPRFNSRFRSPAPEVSSPVLANDAPSAPTPADGKSKVQEEENMEQLEQDLKSILSEISQLGKPRGKDEWMFQRDNNKPPDATVVGGQTRDTDTRPTRQQYNHNNAEMRKSRDVGNSQVEPVKAVPKFCHSCGTAYPDRYTVKFCCECGAKRLFI